MRNPVACVSCRTAKQRCLNNQDGQACERCRTSGKGPDCAYPPPGTSSIHRKPKRPRPSEDVGDTPTSTGPHGANATAPHSASYRRHDAGVPSSGISESPHAAGAPSPNGSASQALLDGLDPFDLLTDEVKNSYLRCSYKWSFHHTPTLLLRIRDRTLEPWMAWAMLALAIRCDEPPLPLLSTV